MNVSLNEIFISYRKNDDPFAAALIDRKLCERFGPDRVFRDSRAIAPGTDFEPRLWGALTRSAVLVVVIGPRWLAAGPTGQRYVDSPDDFVRQEIALALRADVHVVPVLVGDVPPLKRESLPADIGPLATRQYLRLNSRNDDYDLLRIGDELARIIRDRSPVAHRTTVMSVAADGGGVDTVGAMLRAAVQGAKLTTAVVREREHGVVVLAPEPVPPITLLSELVPAIRNRLALLDETTVDQFPRLRLAVAQGSITDHGGQLSGEPMDVTDRLLGSAAVRHIFSVAPAVRLTVAVSNPFYRNVVVPNYALVDASTFHRFQVGPDDPNEMAWAQVPGSSAPPPLPRPESDRTRRTSSTVQYNHGSNVNNGTVNGDMVHGDMVHGDMVHGDKVMGDRFDGGKHIHYGPGPR